MTFEIYQNEAGYKSNEKAIDEETQAKIARIQAKLGETATSLF